MYALHRHLPTFSAFVNSLRSRCQYLIFSQHIPMTRPLYMYGSGVNDLPHALSVLIQMKQGGVMYLGVFPTLGWCSRRVWPIVWWAADRARILGGAGHFGCECSRPDKILQYSTSSLCYSAPCWPSPSYADHSDRWPSRIWWTTAVIAEALRAASWCRG